VKRLGTGRPDERVTRAIVSLSKSLGLKVVEGKVEMDANYALEDYEIARGFVLSCQAFPVTDRVVLDFDQDA